MPITPEHLRDFGKRHACDHSDEVTLRAASSRSYYAAFHALHPIVDRLPASRSCAAARVGRLSHTEMVERLKEWRTDRLGVDLSSLVPLKKRMVQLLEVARAARVQADYRLNEHVTLPELEEQIRRVRCIIDAALKISNEISRRSKPALRPNEMRDQLPRERHP